jgi:hypothetical protein
MSLLKVKWERKTVLDINTSKISKRQITQSLRRVELNSDSHPARHTDNITYVGCAVKVGMYRIVLDTAQKLTNLQGQRLRNLGKFRVSIFEINGDLSRPIDLVDDSRFNNQNWVLKNDQTWLGLSDLTNIIYHCHRLNSLKLFL